MPTDPELQKRRAITWKDADMNLCTLAASMLEEVEYMRTNENWTPGGLHSYFPEGTQLFWTEPAEVERAFDDPVKPGYLKKLPTSNPVGFWSQDRPKEYAFLSSDRSAHTGFLDNPAEWRGVTTLCWYSFTMIVRHRLNQARQELVENLFKQNKRTRYGKVATRNPIGRKKWQSKYGRSEER